MQWQSQEQKQMQSANRFLKACTYNDLEMLRETLAEYPQNTKQGLENASILGHYRIVLFLIDSGATQFSDAGPLAISRGNVDIVRLMLKRDPSEINPWLVSACQYDNFEIANMLIDYKATNFMNGFEVCYKNKSYHCMKLLLDRGTFDYNVYLNYAMRPYEIIPLLEINTYLPLLSKIHGYDKLLLDLDAYKKNTTSALSIMLLPDLIDIINEYTIL